MKLYGLFILIVVIISLVYVWWADRKRTIKHSRFDDINNQE